MNTSSIPRTSRIRATVTASEIKSKLTGVANRLVQDDQLFHAEHSVNYPQDIPGKKEKLTVAVVNLNAETINVRDMFCTCGDGRPRVYQNTLLLDLTEQKLLEGGMEVFTHHLIPPNDGGISLGQALAAQEILRREV